MNKLDSISLGQASRGSRDVIVIGAGPAGAMAAYELARRSLRVLLVDKSRFPRAKVCGCCLNGQALGLLQAHGLGHLIHDAVPLRRVMLACSGHRAALPLETGVALSRQTLDMSLIDAAVESGATFLPEAEASLSELSPSARRVVLRSNGCEEEVEAAVVLAADGLSGRIQNRGVARESRVGAAIIVDRSPTFYQPQTIYMACGSGGYVGLVRLEDGRLNIAAAFDGQALRGAGQCGRLAMRILQEAGLPPVPVIADLPWKGTPGLTRHVCNLAAERLFVVGDAAAFVEPFTGEGIAWALRSAIAVAPLAARAVTGWQPGLEIEWSAIFHREVERRQAICRVTAAQLRRPRLIRMVVQLLALFPSLSRPFLRHLNGDPILKRGMAQ